METLKEFFATNEKCSESIEHLLYIHLMSFLHEPKLANFDLARIHRICTIWMNNHQGVNIKPIIDFLFTCLDVQGTDASVLFSLIPVTEHEDYMLDKCFTTYANVFTSDFMSKDHFRYLYQKSKLLEFKNQLLLNTLSKRSK